MKKRFSILATCVCVLCALALVLAGCGNSGSNANSGSSSSNGGSDAAASDGKMKLATEGTLTCVTEMGFQPFEYLLEGSTDPVGYDIDVANELAKRMGLTCKFLPSQNFDTLIPTVAEGSKADIAIAGITINDERIKEIDFSGPYFTSNLAVVVKGDSAETLQTLDAPDKQVACQRGTTGDGWIDENLAKATKMPLDDISAGLAGVSTGNYAAYVIDLPVAEKNLKDSFTDLKILEKVATGEEYGIAVSKKNPELTKAINKALGEMKADGTMDKISEKWLSNNAV